MKRPLAWANRNPAIFTLIMSVLVMSVGLLVHQSVQNTNVRNAKEQAVAEAEARADQIAASQLDVCQRAVTAVTDQLNADLLKITTSFTSEGKPKPAWAIQLEFIISNRAPPTAACIPKESP